MVDADIWCIWGKYGKRCDHPDLALILIFHFSLSRWIGGNRSKLRCLYLCKLICIGISFLFFPPFFPFFPPSVCFVPVWDILHINLSCRYQLSTFSLVSPFGPQNVLSQTVVMFCTFHVVINHFLPIDSPHTRSVYFGFLLQC